MAYGDRGDLSSQRESLYAHVGLASSGVRRRDDERLTASGSPQRSAATIVGESRPDASLVEHGADSVEGNGVGGFASSACETLLLGFDVVGGFP